MRLRDNGNKNYNYALTLAVDVMKFLKGILSVRLPLSSGMLGQDMLVIQQNVRRPARHAQLDTQ